ncbi:MAG: putative outer membrane protein [Cyclobacteriaceae bacterium]|jgi:predicted outer membrane protein
MKYIYLFLGALLLITSCQNKSYYEVMNVNQQRFGGWELDNARFLNESYDLILLVGDMSALAQKRSTLKESYLIASEASKNSSDLHFDYKMEAAKQRIKLITSLSKDNDDYLHQLDEIAEVNFDRIYAQSMKTKLKELSIKMEDYTANGKNNRLVELADEVQDCYRNLNISISEMGH